MLGRSHLGLFFKVNSDIFLRTLCLCAVTLWFTHAGAASGVDTLGANALLLQLFLLFSYFMDGFAYAGEALGGNFHGAGDAAALRRLIRVLMLIGVIAATVTSAVYALGGEWILRLLTDSESVRSTALTYLPWAAAIPLCGFAAFVWDGILIGLTRTRIMLGAMAVAVPMFFAVYLSTRSWMGNHGLWLAFDVYLLLRGAVSALLYRKLRSDNNR